MLNGAPFIFNQTKCQKKIKIYKLLKFAETDVCCKTYERKLDDLVSVCFKK